MMPSASSVGRALACPASHILPREDRGGRAADDGTARHEALAAYLEHGRVPAESSLAAWVQGLDEAGVLEPLRGAESEVAMARDVVWGGGRLIGRHVGREYGDVSPSEVVGSADYLRFDGQTVEVVDLKTGRGEVPPAQSNQQLLTLALLARSVYGGRAVRVGLLLAPEGGTPRWDWADIDDATLAGHHEKLVGLYQRLAVGREQHRQGKPLDVQPGTHCRYCPARGACPAQQSLAKQAAATPETFRATWQASLAAGEAAPVYRALLALRSEADAIEEAMREAARQGPLDVGDGRQYGWRVVQRESIDAEAAWTVLGERYGVDVARQAMTLATSKAGIERALRPVVEARKASGEKVTLKRAAEEALGALREAGAVQQQSNERCEEMAK